MVNTPVGVSWPFLPVLTVVTPMRMPLRYAYARCSVMLTMTAMGPGDAPRPPHIHWPGLRSPGRVSAGLDCLAPHTGMGFAANDAVVSETSSTTAAATRFIRISDIALRTKRKPRTAARASMVSLRILRSGKLLRLDIFTLRAASVARLAGKDAEHRPACTRQLTQRPEQRVATPAEHRAVRLE